MLCGFFEAPPQTLGKDLGYQVIAIDANPDSELIEKIASLPTCQFSRHYEQDNLNHDVFTLYY